MNRIMKITMEDMGKRQKSMIPSWLIGTGADFGELNPYSRILCMMLLVNIFYKEINGDGSRTRENLVSIVCEICQETDIAYKEIECEKIVDSLLINSNKRDKIAFQEKYYNEKLQKWVVFQFQYLELDRDFCNYENGLFVYKLTEESQAIVLNSHEIIDSMDINMQQLIAELLIKKGNLKNALNMMDTLDFRVRQLLNTEKSHREELIRFPEKILSNSNSIWGDNLIRVKMQFEDELDRYNKMNNILSKLKVLEEQIEIVEQLKRRIISTRNLHDILAKIVVENIRLEIQILNNEFDLMWSIFASSFRRTIWEDNVLKNGFENPDDMISLVELLLSPKKPFLFPLQWGICEQHLVNHSHSFVNIEKNKSYVSHPIIINWEGIVELWESVFFILLEKKEVSVECINTFDEEIVDKWINNREAMDFWIDFGTIETEIIVNEEFLNDSQDYKVQLINKIIEKNSIFKNLINKRLSSHEVESKEVNIKNSVYISEFKILIKDVKEYD